MRKIQWLEALRGLAALWVLLHHGMQSTADFIGHAGLNFKIFANGYMGVDFFFVLSGFIIAMSSDRLVSTGRGLREYFTARSIRIYIPYLPVGIAMLFLYTFIPGLSEGNRESLSVLTSLTLLPTNSPPALSVAWTLVHEIIFYAIFSLFFISRKALVWVVTLWSVSIIAVWFSGIELFTFASYFLSPLNLCFVLGVVTYWATKREINKGAGVVTLILGLLLVGSQAWADEPNRLMVACGFAALIIASLSPILLSLSPGRALSVLGAASYSIYLIHNPALTVLIRLARNYHLSPSVVLLIISIGALMAGLIYHFAYERYALKWVRDRIERTTKIQVMKEPARVET